MEGASKMGGPGVWGVGGETRRSTWDGRPSRTWACLPPGGGDTPIKHCKLKCKRLQSRRFPAAEVAARHSGLFSRLVPARGTGWVGRSTWSGARAARVAVRIADRAFAIREPKGKLHLARTELATFSVLG